jgi:RNA polymerase sigma-70 factor, ECF subfamily
VSSEAAGYFSDALADITEVHVPACASSPVAVPSNSESARLVAIASPVQEHSDEALLLQVSKGSKEALSILFQRHARSVFNVAHRILRDHSEAEDLLQDLFLFLFQKAGLFDATKSSAVSWIIQMTYHRAIDRRRYLSARHHYSAQELDEGRHHGTTGQISIDEVAARALLNRLREELSPEQRETLELHFFEGYTFHEIADKTGQTFGNVRHHYYRSLERLRSSVFPGKTNLK